MGRQNTLRWASLKVAAMLYAGVTAVTLLPHAAAADDTLVIARDIDINSLLGQGDEGLELGRLLGGQARHIERVGDRALEAVAQLRVDGHGLHEREVFLGRSVTTHKNISEASMQKVDAEIRRILDEQYGLARQLIEANRDKMEAMAKALLEWETIESDQIDAILAGREPNPPKDGGARSSGSDAGGGGASPVKPDAAPTAA